jgi:hypothetical protein
MRQVLSWTLARSPGLRSSAGSFRGGGACRSRTAGRQRPGRWRKASYSGNGGGSCVEVARNLSRVVAVRDSKDPHGPILTIEPEGWQDFIADVKAGQHNLT